VRSCTWQPHLGPCGAQPRHGAGDSVHQGFTQGARVRPLLSLSTTEGVEEGSRPPLRIAFVNTSLSYALRHDGLLWRCESCRISLRSKINILCFFTSLLLLVMLGQGGKSSEKPTVHKNSLIN